MEEVVGSNPISSTICFDNGADGYARKRCVHCDRHGKPGVRNSRKDEKKISDSVSFRRAFGNKCTYIGILSILLLFRGLSLAQVSNVDAIPTGVLISIQATGLGKDIVSITYPKVLSESEARADVDNLVKETHWTVSDVQISTRPGEAKGESGITSIDFTTPSAVQLNSGGLLVEPFVKTFKRLTRIDILYIVPPDFSFVGLKWFENKFVKIALQRGTNTYRYSILIKDQSFDKLGLPFLQPDTPYEPAKKLERKQYQNSRKIYLLIVAIAFVAGTATYLATSWLMKRASMRFE